MGRRPLVRRRWRRGYGVSRPCTARDASLATATTSSATTVSASMQDAFCVPSCPANVPEVSRGRRLPCLDVHPARNRAPGASGSIRPRRPSIKRRGASVPTRVHLPTQVRHTRVSRHAHWHLGVGIHELWRRACTGFPPAVWSPSLSGWLPTTPPQGGSHMAATIAPAPKRHQRNLLITLAAAARKADLAPRHYRIAPPGDRPRKTTSAASRRRPVVTGRCASDRPTDEHPHGAHHRLVGAGRRHAGPAGVRRPRDAPAALDGHDPQHPRRAAGTFRPHRHGAVDVLPPVAMPAPPFAIASPLATLNRRTGASRCTVSHAGRCARPCAPRPSRPRAACTGG